MILEQIPSEFIASLKSDYGDSLAQEILQGLSLPRENSIRLNPRKPASLPIMGFEGAEPVLWTHASMQGYYVQERPIFAWDPLWHCGAYYVQDASSMILASLLAPHILLEQPCQVLDLCAAPGGKSTLLYDLLPPHAVLVANEPISKRAQILKENLLKWNGGERCMVTRTLPHEWAKTGETFDIVLVDAPCSGEGLFRKDAEAVEMWSPGNVAMCQARQREILESADQLVRPGGILVYSTCTLNKKENEGQVDYLLQNFDYEPIPLSPHAIRTEWGVWVSEHDGLHLFPGRVRGEGLFVILLRKKEEGTPPSTVCSRPSSSGKGKAQSKGEISRLPQYCKEMEHLETREEDLALQWEGTTHLISAQLAPLWEQCRSSSIPVLLCGIPAFSVKGSKTSVEWGSTMSSRWVRHREEEWVLSEEEARSYLRGETFAAPFLMERFAGWMAVSYGDVLLGGINGLKNRFNNLYPKEYRLRMQTLPTSHK